MIRGRVTLCLGLLLVLFLVPAVQAAVLTVTTNETDATEPGISSNFTENTTMQLTGFSSCTSISSAQFFPSSTALFSYGTGDIYSCTQQTTLNPSANSISVDGNGVITCSFSASGQSPGTVTLLVNMSGKHSATDASTTWTSNASGASCSSSSNTGTTSVSLLAPSINLTKNSTSDIDSFYLGDNTTQYIKAINIQNSTNNGRSKGLRLFVSSFNSTAFVMGSSLFVLDTPLASGSTNTTAVVTNQTSQIAVGSYLFTFFVNDTSGKFNQTFTRNVSVVNLTIQNNMTIEDKAFGTTLELLAKIDGNATALENVTANVTFNAVQINQIVPRQKTVQMQFKQSAGTSLIYNASLLLNSSYQYNVTYTVNETYQYFGSEAPRQKILNTSASFNVPPATPAFSIQFPGAAVLENQSGVLNITINSTTGDLQNISMIINSTNTTVTNVTSASTQNLAINLSNGTQYTFSWNASYLFKGTTKLNVTVVAKNQTSSQLLDLIVVKPSLTLEKNVANISQNNTIEVGVVGNITSIQNVLFFINSTITGKNISSTQAAIVRKDPASTCLRDAVSGSSQDIANSQNATAVANDGTNDYTGGALSIGANLAIDSDNSTKWLGKASASENGTLNITFDKNYTLSQLAFTWNDTSNGKIDINYYDSQQSSSWKNLLRNQNLPDTKNRTLYDSFDPVTTDRISVLVAGQENVFVYDVEAYPVVIAANGDCFIYQFNATNSQLSSGTANTNITVSTASNTSLQSSSYEINFGRANITFIDGLSSSSDLAFVNTNRNLSYNVTAIEGDVRSIIVNLTIQNTTVVNVTQAIKSNFTFANISSGTSQTIVWELRGGGANYADNSTTINTSAYSNTSQASSAYLTANVTLRVADSQNPQVFAFTLDRNLTNLQDVVIVTANVSDDNRVDQVIVEIERNDSIKTNVTKNVNIVSGLVNVTFDNSTHLGQLGNYTVRVYAKDLIGNTVIGSTNATFNTSSMYTINLTNNNSVQNITVFNRGETLNFAVLDINNRTVSNALLNISEMTIPVATGNATNFSSLFEQTNATYNRVVLENDTVGRYTLRINATKNGNGVIMNATFNVTNQLTLSFTNSFATPYATGQKLGVIQALVANYRGDQNITTANVTLFCPNLNQTLASANFGQIYQYADTCTAPGSAGASFSVNANTTYQNNTGDISASLATQSASGSGSGGAGAGSAAGGGGGGGGTTTIISAPASDKSNFEMELPTTSLQGTAGSETTFVVTLRNTGDKPLSIDLSTFSFCCSVDIETPVVLKVKESKGVSATVSIPLITEKGDYEISVDSKSGEIEKSGQVILSVGYSEELTAFSRIAEQLAETERTLLSFKDAGVDVSSELQRLDEAKKKLASVEDVRKSADVQKLASLAKELGQESSSLQRAVLAKKTLYYIALNKTSVLLGLLGAFSSFAYLWMYSIPYFIATSRIHQLNAAATVLINTRKATEKQYFLRQIDENTFGSIMAKEQDKILKVRSLLKEYDEIVARIKSGYSVPLKKLPSVEIETQAEKKKSKYQLFLEKLKGGNSPIRPSGTR